MEHASSLFPVDFRFLSGFFRVFVLFSLQSGSYSGVRSKINLPNARPSLVASMNRQKAEIRTKSSRKNRTYYPGAFHLGEGAIGHRIKRISVLFCPRFSSHPPVLPYYFYLKNHLTIFGGNCQYALPGIPGLFSGTRYNMACFSYGLKLFGPFSSQSSFTHPPSKSQPRRT